MQMPSEPFASSFPPSDDAWESRHGLIRGKRYQVTKGFVDADGDAHQPGESWQFLGAMFNKFEDEVQIDVSCDHVVMRIPLSWKAGDQAHVIENVADYVG